MILFLLLETNVKMIICAQMLPQPIFNQLPIKGATRSYRKDVTAGGLLAMIFLPSDCKCLSWFSSYSLIARL